MTNKSKLFGPLRIPADEVEKWEEACAIVSEAYGGLSKAIRELIYAEAARIKADMAKLAQPE